MRTAFLRISSSVHFVGCLRVAYIFIKKTDSHAIPRFNVEYCSRSFNAAINNHR